MDNSWHILAPSGVSTKSGEVQWLFVVRVTSAKKSGQPDVGIAIEVDHYWLLGPWSVGMGS
jgi:hypothetical protein